MFALGVNTVEGGPIGSGAVAPEQDSADSWHRHWVVIISVAEGQLVQSGAVWPNRVQVAMSDRKEVLAAGLVSSRSEYD